MAQQTKLWRWKWKECTNSDCDLGEGHNHLPVKFKACGNCKHLLKTVYNWPLLTHVIMTLMMVCLVVLAVVWYHQEREAREALKRTSQEVEAVKQREIEQLGRELKTSRDQANREEKELEDKIAELNRQIEARIKPVNVCEFIDVSPYLEAELVRLEKSDKAKQQEIRRLNSQLEVATKRNIDLRKADTESQNKVTELQNKVKILSEIPYCKILENHLSLICHEGVQK